jgi:integrase
MPKMAAELSAIEIKRLKHLGGDHRTMVAAGGVSGLHLQLLPSGGKSWILRTLVAGKRREIGLGGFPDVTLAQARERARDAKDAIRRGVDPIEERKAARASLVAARRRGLLFKDAVDQYLVAKLEGFRNEKHRYQWRATLETYAVPTMGEMLVAEITVQDVHLALGQIWTTKTETATRLRGRIEAVLDWAKVSGHRSGDNPARWKGNLDALLPKPGQVARSVNHPALSIADAPAWFAALRLRNGTAARALEFLTLCAARSGEVRGATWDEFDLAAALWTIPADRMKAVREHRVPLTPAAVAIVEAMPRLKDSPFVFAAPRAGQLSDMTLSAVMKRMQEAEVAAGRNGWLDPRTGRPAVPHGLRSTFRDWAAERTDYPRDMAEIALAHNVGSDVERAYRRGDQMEKRRAMMADWARYLEAKA